MLRFTTCVMGACAALVSMSVVSQSAWARTQIVAIGTSTTLGRGVPANQTYPAQLEAALRAKGYDVQIKNMGINGDTSAGMLARLKTIPRGTQLVILEIWPNGESRGGITNSEENAAAIHAQLAARNIKVIDLQDIVLRERKAANRAGELVETPAGLHMNAVAYSRVAADVMPSVEAAIGR